MKKTSTVAYAQALVIRVIFYGILGYHNDGLLSVWYKKFEITDGTLNFMTMVETTKELKIQDALNSYNPITKRVFDDKSESVYFYCNNLSHSNSYTVGFVTSGANVSKSNSTNFSFKTSTGHITFDVSGIYEIHFKDVYKGPACNIHMSPGNVNPNIVFVYIEDKNNEWTDIKVFYPISVTAGYEVRIQTGQEMLDSGS